MDETTKAAREQIKETKKEGTSFNDWKCMSCEGEPEFGHVEMMKHLQEVHGFNPKTTKGSRQMTLHLDGRDWYQTNYRWEINGLVFMQFVRNARNKHTRMY